MRASPGWLGCLGPSDEGLIGAVGLREGEFVRLWISCVVLGFAALTLPNTQEIMRRELRGISRPHELSRAAGHGLFLFRRSAWWAIAAGVLLAVGLTMLLQPTSFLYFNF